MEMERRAEESRSSIQTRLTGSEQYFETSGRYCDAASHPLSGEADARWINALRRLGAKPHHQNWRAAHAAHGE